MPKKTTSERSTKKTTSERLPKKTISEPLPVKMTPERLTEIRESMCWSMRALAKMRDMAESGIRQMEDGQRPIPQTLADWLESLAAWLKKNPPPKKSR